MTHEELAKTFGIPVALVKANAAKIHASGKYRNEYQALLNALMPRSYNCRRFGKRHACQFEMLCFYREGWANPLGGGHYLPRRPHHQPELDQAIGRGLMLPEDGVGETEADWE